MRSITAATLLAIKLDISTTSTSITIHIIGNAITKCYESSEIKKYTENMYSICILYSICIISFCKGILNFFLLVFLHNQNFLLLSKSSISGFSYLKNILCTFKHVKYIKSLHPLTVKTWGGGFMALADTSVRNVNHL